MAADVVTETPKLNSSPSKRAASATQRGPAIILLCMTKNRQWLTALLGAALMVTPAFASPRAQSDQGASAKQDMKQAGRDTKNGAKDAARGTEKGTKKAWHGTKKDTKKAWHKTKSTTKGAVKGAKQGAKQPQ